jgi:hypothetical protein
MLNVNLKSVDVEIPLYGDFNVLDGCTPTSFQRKKVRSQMITISGTKGVTQKEVSDIWIQVLRHLARKALGEDILVDIRVYPASAKTATRIGWFERKAKDRKRFMYYKRPQFRQEGCETYLFCGSYRT